MGSPTGWNMADLWEVIADTLPDAPALIHGERSHTWGELDRRADGVARRLLDAGLGHQHKVAQYLYNTPEYLESVLAAWKAALVPVNTNFRYREAELVYLWDNADVAAVVFHGTFVPTIERIRDRLPGIALWLWVDDQSEPCPDWATPYEASASSGAERRSPPWGRSLDDLYLLYTGGTTGFPKGVMWRSEDLFLIGNRTAKVRFPDAADRSTVVSMLTEPGPRHLVTTPLMHGLGSFTAFQCMASGGCVVTLPWRSLDVEVLLDECERRQINSMVIAGDAIARPLLEALDAAPDRWDLSSMRVLSSSGAMWSAPVKERLARHLPHVLMVDTLGSSEALGMGSSVTGLGREARTARFASGPDTRVLADDGTWLTPGSPEPGRVARRGPTSIGYYKDPERTAVTYRIIDGERWSLPGDYATVEPDGSLTLLGRGASCINTGGEKVYPEEVEEALKEHPAVRDAIVVGVPDERLGQVVTAAVELERGHRFDQSMLIEHVRQRLAGYKAPRVVHQVNSVGRSPTGKLDYVAWAKRLSGAEE
jgi:acyl-CoA synthetase (AMP-forming)/AMP-acid ligase II